MSGELYRLPYKTASNDRGLLEDTVRRSCERLIGFQEGAPICFPPLVSACHCFLLRALLWLLDRLSSYPITFSIWNCRAFLTRLAISRNLCYLLPFFRRYSRPERDADPSPFLVPRSKNRVELYPYFP
jgi:hypothetical protein